MKMGKRNTKKKLKIMWRVENVEMEHKERDGNNVESSEC